MKMKLVMLTCLTLALAAGPASALIVIPTNDASTLVGTILGGGVSVANLSYTGAPGASGTFTGGGAAGIDIEAGIILTTGAATLAPGPNNDDFAGVDNNLPGDPVNLDPLIPGYVTYDATILSFDFTVSDTETSSIFFNYVFASEEYNEYVGSEFNDVFGFFLDGTNVALIPSTTTPVSINNVNNGVNSAYYNDNDLTNGIPTPYDIEYDGFTDGFTVAVLDLAPGVHTITFAIADAGDGILDSAVFIQADTFAPDPTPIDPDIPEPATMILTGLGLAAMAARRRFRA